MPTRQRGLWARRTLRGWYLSAAGQMLTLYAMRPFIAEAAGFTQLSGRYWSSTPSGDGNAWVYFDHGAVWNDKDGAKGKAYKVRAMRNWEEAKGSIPAPALMPNALESMLLAQANVVSNPFGGVLVLEGMRDAERVEVYSIQGVLMHSQRLQGETRVAIDARGWASGVYMALVVARDGERALRAVRN